MSAKSSKWSLRKKPVLRELTEIQKEFGELCFKAGQAQYQIKVLEMDLKNTNDRINAVNVEASERKKLDSETKKEAKNAIS